MNKSVLYVLILLISSVNLNAREMAVQHPFNIDWIQAGADCFFDFGFLKGREKKSETGFAVINIIDSETDEPVDGMIEFKNSKIPPMFIEDGNRKIEIPCGKYTVKVMSDECMTLTRDINVVPGKIEVLFFDMERAESCGQICGMITDFCSKKFILPEIEVLECEDCRIIINDTTGDYSINLMPGKYTLSAKREGYAEYLREVTVLSGKTNTVDISMMRLKDRFKMNDVAFLKGKADLKEDSYKYLDNVCDALIACKDVKIEIQCFTDDKGYASENLLLSQKRAERVRAYFVGRGIEEFRIKTRGFGETMNIADNETEENREKNRRVEFIILED
ncbi:MAG: OmpA family protein [bacterium]